MAHYSLRDEEMLTTYGAMESLNAPQSNHLRLQAREVVACPLDVSSACTDLSIFRAILMYYCIVDVAHDISSNNI